MVAPETVELKLTTTAEEKVPPFGEIIGAGATGCGILIVKLALATELWEVAETEMALTVAEDESVNGPA